MLQYSHKLKSYGVRTDSSSMDIKKNGYTSLLSKGWDTEVKNQLPKLTSFIILVPDHVWLFITPKDISRNLRWVSYSMELIPIWQQFLSGWQNTASARCPNVWSHHISLAQSMLLIQA